jgi:cytochrome c-type biogenesis protein
VNAFVAPFIAVAAGIVSASSPCVLPVIPGYLAAVTPTTNTADWKPSRRGAVAFIAGFTLIFTALGATASLVGALLYEHLATALKIAGVVLILLGASTMGLLRVSAIDRERRLLPLHRSAADPRRAFILGVAFALGWTPCIGPILATILTKAAADASLAEGVILLALYSVGLGIPFLAVAIWFERTNRARGWLGRHAMTLQRLGGLMMVIAGVGYVTGAWAGLFTGLQRWLARTGWPPI